MVDTIIIEKLDESGYRRRCDLVQEIMEEHEGKTGFSKPTIDRAIARLVKNGTVKILGIEDLHSLGIEESDKNASYLFSQRYIQLMEFMDTVMDDLKSEDENDILAALEEIESHQDQYILAPYQLDKLAVLVGKNRDVTACSLWILFDYAMNRKINPGNIPQFREYLRLTIELFKDEPVYQWSTNTPSVFAFNEDTLRREVYKIAIMLLGNYQDDFVVERLIADCQRDGSSNQFLRYYGTQSTAKIIDAHKVELYKFQKKLKDQGLNDTAKKLSEIRSTATRLAFKKLSDQDDGEWADAL